MQGLCESHMALSTLLSCSDCASSYLPPGTSFNIPPYTLHRDPGNFSFPEEFWPERWLISSSQLSGKLKPADLPSRTAEGFSVVHNEDAFIPFSVGPMNCVGKNLALVEMRVLVCVLLQRFKFRLRQGWKPNAYMENYRDFLVAARPPLPAVLQPRS